MNKYEMVEEVENMFQTKCATANCDDCVGTSCFMCQTTELHNCQATELHNANRRIIGDDEIVIKKSVFEALANDLDKGDYGEFENGFSQGYEYAKKETVREILKDLNDEGYKIYKQQGNTFDEGNFNWLIAYAMRKYGIESED